MLTKKYISFKFILHGSWRNLIYVLVTSVLAYLVDRLLLDAFMDSPTLIPTILGTALAFFIGFNNNQAYDRWWEGRKIWGMVVNNSRSWARQWLQYSMESGKMGRPHLKELRKRAVRRQIAFVYALKETLRDVEVSKYRKFVADEEVKLVEKESNIPNALLSEHAKDLQTLYDAGGVDGFKFHSLNGTLNNLCDDMGKCERIKNTVFPTTYNYYTRIFVFIFVVFEVWGTAESIGMWSIFTGTMIGYIFLTTQAIGQALLNPFEETPAALPLDQISRTIEINLLEMQGGARIPEPLQATDEEFIT